jgi:hypothetical protein
MPTYTLEIRLHQYATTISHTMENLIKKQSIVQSLESMNQVEIEKVIGYIKELLYRPENDSSHHLMRERALKEIKAALLGSKGDMLTQLPPQF